MITKIKNKNAGQRLDKFISQKWPEYSRSYLKRQIKESRILVNGQTKKPSYILKENDKIEAEILPPPKISLEPDASIKLNIVYEDKDIIVINKPAGLTIHPGDAQKSGTLVNGLLAHYPLLKNVGDPSLRQAQGKLVSGQVNLRPGIVHRLDKDTSGLMVIAKNQKTFDFLKNQFQQRKVIKKYLALIVGVPKESSGTIKTYLARSKSDPTKQKISNAPGDREAITSYKVIETFRDFSLLEVRPKTGRMHQIRVHLAWLGCPVAGDQKYGPAKLVQSIAQRGGKKTPNLPFELKRQFLHAFYLKITLPDGRIKEFKSPLPDDLKKALQALEKNGN